MRLLLLDPHSSTQLPPGFEAPLEEVERERDIGVPELCEAIAARVPTTRLLTFGYYRGSCDANRGLGITSPGSTHLTKRCFSRRFPGWSKIAVAHTAFETEAAELASEPDVVAVLSMHTYDTVGHDGVQRAEISLLYRHENDKLSAPPTIVGALANRLDGFELCRSHRAYLLPDLSIEARLRGWGVTTPALSMEVRKDVAALPQTAIRVAQAVAEWFQAISSQE